MPLEEALDFFYHSQTYDFMRRGVSDMHAMSDVYLSDCLKDELANQPSQTKPSPRPTRHRNNRLRDTDDGHLYTGSSIPRLSRKDPPPWP